MIQIVLLIIILFLAVRGILYLVNTVYMKNGHGKRLRKMVDEDRLTPDLVEEIEHKRVTDEIREAKKLKLTSEQRKRVRAAERKERTEYLDNFNVSFYQLVYIFVIASMLGLLLEEIWMFINFGIKESRVGLVWGPFSPLYGFGAVLLTMVLWRLRKRPWWQIFLLAAVLGTLLEQLTGWGMETFAHAESWNYLSLPDHITQWTAWRFVVMWGILGLVWVRVILPEMLYLIGRPTTRQKRVVVGVLVAFLAADIFVTISCFSRNNERAEGIPAHNAYESWIDEHYDSDFINSRFENLTVDEG